MSEKASDPMTTVSTDGTPAHRPWHAPAIEEVDVLETQFGSGIYTYADSQTYSS